MTSRRASTCISPDRHPLSGAEEAAFFGAAANEAERVTTRSRDDDRLSSHARVGRVLTVRHPPTRRPLSSPAAPSRSRRFAPSPRSPTGPGSGRPPLRPHPHSRASRSPAERKRASPPPLTRICVTFPAMLPPRLPRPRPPSPSPSSYLTSTSREDVEDVEGAGHHFLAEPVEPARTIVVVRSVRNSFPRSTSTLSRSSSRLSRARTSARVTRGNSRERDGDSRRARDARLRDSSARYTTLHVRPAAAFAPNRRRVFVLFDSRDVVVRGDASADEEDVKRE